MMARGTTSEPATELRHRVRYKAPEGRAKPNSQVAFVVAVRLVILSPSSVTKKISEGATIRRAGGPNVWPGVLREVLG